MKKLLNTAVVLSLAWMVSIPALASAGDIAVIANGGFPKDSVNLDYLKKVYLGKKVDEGGIAIVPLDYQNNNPVKRDFVGKVLSSTVGKFQAYWLKRIFQEGKTPPKVMQDAQVMVGTVRATKGAIGYLDAGDLKDKAGLKVLHLIK